LNVRFGLWQWFAALAVEGGLSLIAVAQASPVVCTTRQDVVPDAASRVDVTRCSPVVTTQELVERRFYEWTSPYAPGIDITHQLTDLLGIAMGGMDGKKVMGFGFADQTLTWDGTAIENTMKVLFQDQSSAALWRTGDVSNGYCSGLQQGGCNNSGMAPGLPVSGSSQIRGLW